VGFTGTTSMPMRLSWVGITKQVADVIASPSVMHFSLTEESCGPGRHAGP
jgi:hypothetical protein